MVVDVSVACIHDVDVAVLVHGRLFLHGSGAVTRGRSG